MKKKLTKKKEDIMKKTKNSFLEKSMRTKLYFRFELFFSYILNFSSLHSSHPCFEIFNWIVGELQRN
jgi:hypothetical protein